MNAEPLLAFMLERHNIFLRRAAGKPKPWTDDRILQTYRFCNVYRELDKTTVWIDRHIRKPYRAHPHLWFFLAAARQINWPDTLRDLLDAGAFPSTGYEGWNTALARRIMLLRQQAKQQVYGGAYMLTANGYGPDDPRDKAFYTCHLVLAPLWIDRAVIGTAFEGKSMQAAHAALVPHHGWGGFTAYEAVCDARWTRYGKRWTDINTWAFAGPGAVRGLNRLAGMPVDDRIDPDRALEEMRELLSKLQHKWPHVPALELREVEHSLCEFDKYERVRLGEGRPKSKYPGV